MQTPSYSNYIWPEGYDSAFSATFDVDMISGQLWRFRHEGIKSLNELEQRRFGARKGLLRILDVLDRYNVKAGFFVSAHEARMFPDILPSIAARGHEIGMHGVVHEMVQTIAPDFFVEILETSIGVFREQIGCDPVGFRAPAWDLTPACLEILKRYDVLFDSSLTGYDHPYTMDGITEIPISWALDDVPYFRYYGGGSDKWIPVSTTDVTERWTRALLDCQRHNELCMLTMHPWIIGRGIRIGLLESLLQTACTNETMWVTTPAYIARYHSASPNAQRFVHTSDLPVYPENELRYTKPSQ